ncbi:RsfA family transcriptional regulator [Aquibacillus sp. 3ASR75-11]|uniref:RsfA family transcriptional regulator n=1 Tax=Terrihalobacillus insolitus TaxID=2950438 RepID=A0A9X3WQ43_9BACI|nr:RsfA family transcriptional regulator [Terrihalobacillus insolitus]MDC3412422.1 RsfA family transcriptional regulator [Terrihalobacillus insolitus]MDC3423842.1 RsfA family transcriptional regulator [Terrihalobacillus insolitus]
MVKIRQDAWSHEDDLLLAETVLRHIREGSTQLNAFEEVGDKLNRTSAACGFRWNAEVRRRYDQAVAIAKRQRKEKKRAMAAEQKSNEKVSIPAAPTAYTVPDSTNIVDQKPASTTSSTSDHSEGSNQSITLDSVIYYLTTLKQDYQDANDRKNSLDYYQRETENLQKENEELKKKLSLVQEQLNTIQEDYQVLIQIMDRARKMIVFDEDESMSAKAFRMEKNGNLEQVAR